MGIILVAGDDTADRGAGKAVFTVPNEDAVDRGGGGKWAAGHVTVEIMKRIKSGRATHAA